MTDSVIWDLVKQLVYAADGESDGSCLMEFLKVVCDFGFLIHKYVLLFERYSRDMEFKCRL